MLRVAVAGVLVASLMMAIRYAPKAILLSVIVYAMNDTAEPLWQVARLQTQFLLPLLLLLSASVLAVMALRRPTLTTAVVAVLLTFLALADAVLFSTAW